jgi:hypothetical protein
VSSTCECRKFRLNHALLLILEYKWQKS